MLLLILVQYYLTFNVNLPMYYVFIIRHRQFFVHNINFTSVKRFLTVCGEYFLHFAAYDHL